MPAFQYTATTQVAMETAIAAARLKTYVDHAVRKDPAATKDDALDLYVWNLQVSAAFQGPLHLLEVSLRNALHEQLSRHFGADWIDDPGFIHVCILAQFPPPQVGQKTYRWGPDLLKSIHKVRTRVAESLGVKIARALKKNAPITKKSVTVNDVVAGLDFGFWTTMLGSHFDQGLWRPALYRAFPNYAKVTGRALSRRRIAERLNALRNLRNRAMHYEPLFKRNLVVDFQSIGEAISWMYDDVSPWVDHHSRWPHVQAAQANRPETF